MSVLVIASVFRTSKSKGAARLVLLALADVANDTGEVSAYGRSYSVLAGKANVSDSTVQDAITKLVHLGELEVTEVGDGRRSASYVVRLPGLADRDPGYRGSVPTPPKPGTQGTDGRHPISPLPTSPSTPDHTLALVAPEPSPESMADAFDRFWKVYPRRTAPGDARKAWTGALRRASVSVILAGAERFRDDPNREDQFTPYPATWLRGERWADPPLPSRASRGSAPAPPPVDEDRDRPSGRLYL